MKPMVGVMPLWDEKKDSLWMLPGYLEGIRQAGGIPFVFPFTDDEQELDQLVNLCDGIVFTGGHDVSPSLYHEEPLEELVVCCPKRDAMETIVLQKALAGHRSVLGICRGLQFINAALGGTLYQDLPTQHPSEIIHRQKSASDQTSHDVSLIKGSPLQQVLGLDCLPVNSFHHQAVKALAPCLSVMAMAPDGLIEAVTMPDARFLWAVQWHPEFLYRVDPNSRKIFRAFVQSME